MSNSMTKAQFKNLASRRRPRPETQHDGVEITIKIRGPVKDVMNQLNSLVDEATELFLNSDESHHEVKAEDSPSYPREIVISWGMETIKLNS